MQSQTQKSKNKAAVDQELENEYKQLEKNLTSLKTNIDYGNVELHAQEETQKKTEKNLDKVENNNRKSNWIVKTSRSTWGMIKGLFTKPKLVKKTDEDYDDPPIQANPDAIPRIEEKDRLDRVMNLTGDVKESAVYQNEAIKNSKDRINRLSAKEQKIMDDQKKIMKDINKWQKS